MSARRAWAWPLVPVYGAALTAKDLARRAGLAPERRLRWPVISVGSVSAGGAGKTPVVIALAKLLAGRGWVVDVLSRGYGRRGSGVEQVERAEQGDGAIEDPSQRFGDEPLLIAGRSGVPVWVGANRFAAGRAAEGKLLCEAAGASSSAAKLTGDEEDAVAQPVCAHILDDGFQHRSLARQFDLVLVTEEDLGDTLLPAGNLREPLAALRRADAVAVREDEVERIGERVRELCGPDVPLWTLRRTLRFPAPLGVFGAGLRPLAFCALARPENFAAMLSRAGCGLVDTVIFRDHHRYTERDLGLLTKMAKQLQATGLVTTEKDAVKISPAMRARLEAEIGPLMVVALDVNFVYESPVVRALEMRLRAAQSEGQHAEAHVP